MRSLAFAADGQRWFGINDGTALIWNLKTVTPGMAKSASPQDLERLWTGLADDDAAKAHEAMWSLVAAPEEMVRFLQGRLKPVALADQAKIQHWITDLDSSKFAIRQAAAKELEKVGEQVKVPIQKALKGDTTLETRRRLEQILNTMTGVPGPETLRNVRAIMALEWIGSRDAERVLQALARGAPGARETEEAQASLERLATRVPRVP